MADETAVNWFMAAATARATLRALGATKVSLRVSNGGEDATIVGIGLAAPVMESIDLSPVLVRAGSDGSREVVVDASTLQEALSAEKEDVVEIVKAARVSVSGVESMVLGVECDQLGGAPYIYRLRLEA
jgi:hypothetical protein